MTDIESKRVFATNLTRYVEKSGKTQKEIAEIIGVATSTFNDWSTGKKYPRIGKVEALANYFGCEKSDLIEEKKEKSTVNDGLTENQRILIEFARSLSEDQAALALRLLKSLVEED